MNEKEAKQLISDAQVRKRFLEWLWQFRPDAQSENPRPFPPNWNDKQVRRELKRLLTGE